MANIVRLEPFRDLVSLREAMDRLFEERFIQPRVGRLAPLSVGALAVDMYETDQDVVIKSSVPGVKTDDLDITITGDTLTIKGETKTEEKVEKANYVRQERRYGAFSRSVTLPTRIFSSSAKKWMTSTVLTRRERSPWSPLKRVRP